VSTLVDIVVPSESFEGTRSQLLRWLKPAGASVSAGEPLLEIETDKVTMELPAPASGILRECLKAEQDELSVGDLLGRIETDAAAGATGVSGPTPARPLAATAPGEAPRDGQAAAGSSTPTSAAVRRLLAQHALSADAISGSGADGRITVEDVLLHVEGRAAPPPDGAPAASAAPVGTVRRVPHSTIRRRTAAHMVESLLHTAPHVTTVFEADLGNVLAHRAAHRAELEAGGGSLTLTAYFVAACVAAIRAVPEANARWSEDALELIERIDIGIATAIEGRGLLVPVIRDVATLELASIARTLGDLTGRARSDRLTPADVRAGTFTISNHGVSGSLLATPIIINQPQAAILGIGKLEKRAVVMERDGVDVVVVRPRCYVTLTIDHRVMDGHQANRFLATWVSTIERWPA
jgi:2-oxoglutarate dehydrogenase E2 component (dihydrolipoamide succinyltransferase)